MNSVSRRYRKALSGAKLSTVAFDLINASARPESVCLWSAEEEHAQRERDHDIKVMDIYDIKMKQHESGQSTIVLPNIRFQSLPVQKYSLN